MKTNVSLRCLPGILAWLTLIFMFLVLVAPAGMGLSFYHSVRYLLGAQDRLSVFALAGDVQEMRRVMKVDWLARIREEMWARTSKRPSPALDNIYHLVILPMYDEPYAVVRESFASLTRVNYEKKKLLVVLALEDRAGDARRRAVGKKRKRNMARHVREFFGDASSGRICRTRSRERDRTRHGPARRQSARSWTWHIPGIPPENVLVSVFDIDTQVFPEYFSRLTYVFLKTPEPFARDLSADPALYEQRVRGADARARCGVLDDLLANDATIASRAAHVVLIAIHSTKDPARYRLVAEGHRLRGLAHFLAGIYALSRRLPCGGVVLSGLDGRERRAEVLGNDEEYL